MPKYAVLAEGWLTNARGHGAHYVPAGEGEEPVTIEMGEVQAEYLLGTGQIGPIPGETKGYPADAETGKALDLTAEERARMPELAPAGEEPSEVAEGVAGADLSPTEPAETVIGTDGNSAGRSASRRRG